MERGAHGVVAAEGEEAVEVHHDVGGRFYFMTWVWLLLFTVVEVSLVLGHVPRALLVAGLLLLTLLKASLIVANFMHVRFERLNLLCVVLTPMFLLAVLFFGVAPDFSALFQR